jgi:hypothetical protein
LAGGLTFWVARLKQTKIVFDGIEFWLLVSPKTNADSAGSGDAGAVFTPRVTQQNKELVLQTIKTLLTSQDHAEREGDAAQLARGVHKILPGRILYHNADLVEPIVATLQRHVRLNLRAVYHYPDDLERSIGGVASTRTVLATVAAAPCAGVLLDVA